MKKLLKGVLSLAIIAAVGIPQAQAATNDYSIEVKSKKFSKQTTKGFYGIGYTEGNASYTDQYWPLVEGHYSLPLDKATYYNGNTKQQIVRQFGVSMGVVYWINPDRNEICWWNTVTGESGSTTPSLKYPDNYTVGAESPNVSFNFNAKLTGPGTMSHDWYGNLVHMWNESAGWTDNSFVQGYAVYKAATTYGELMDFHPKISYMNGTDYPVYRRKLNADGTLTGKTDTDDGHYTYNYTYYEPGTANGALRNPNYPADDLNWNTNYDYHKANDTYTKKRTDFMGVSGNLWGKGFKSGGNFSYSSYYAGYASGYVFHARNDIAFGNMFADGQYTNWYLNYLLFGGNRVYNDYRPVKEWWLASDIINWYKPWASAQTFYPNERLFRECDVLEYWWSVPNAGLAEFNAYYSVGTNRPNYKWRGWVDDLDLGLPDYDYLSSSERRQTDAMSAPEIDSIKGTRILIHNYWLQFTPGASVEGSASATGNQPKRNGMFMIRSLKYNGGTMNNSVPLYTGNIATSTNAVLDYDKVGCAFGYNNTANTPVKFTETAVNCWPELERVNDNVFALYTHVPGQGFSKFFITAVKPNNAVSNLKVAQSWNPNGDPVHTLTWTPQAGDRATMHTYEVWYRKKKGSTYEDKKTIDGASRDVWNFAGKASVNYKGASDSTKVVTSGTKTYTIPNATFYNSYEGCKFEFVAPRGDNGDGTKYERTYEYMVIPVYDASSHRGTEATTSIVTAPAPGKVYGNLYQVTEKNANGDTLYGFSIRLDPYFLPGAQGSTEAKRLIITSAGGVEGSDKLKDAVSVTLADGTPLTPLDNITFQSSSSGSTTTYNAYALSIDITGKVGADGKLPSIIWHNVNPELEFQLEAHIESTSAYQYSGTGNLSTTLVVPELVWSVPPADFYKLAGDYGSLTKNEDMPIGSFRRIDPNTKQLDENPTNPVTLNNANYYGTNGGLLRPIYVTNEVLGVKNSATGMYENPGWKVSYVVKLFDVNGKEIQYGAFNSQTNTEGYAVCYSNENSVFFDMIGFKVDYEEKTGEDGRTRKVYNPTQKTYKAQIIVVYERLNDEGEVDGMKVERSTYTDVILGTTTLPGLDVESTSGSAVLGALYERKGSHFYYNGVNDEGYYPYYYDAAMLFNWSEINQLNRYMGYYGATNTTCYGHYENQEHNPNTWVQYHAGSVLPDSEVDLLNQTNAALIGGGIGYDGTNNWSALAIEKSQVPMMIHYVHGGNTSLVTNDASATSNEIAVSEVKFDVTLTAEYPIVYRADDKPAHFKAAEDPSTYSIALGSSAMNVMTVPSSLSDMYVTSTTVTTGVEGILTEVCGGVKLYPNPVGSTFTLEAPMVMNEVTIYTIDGQLVKGIKGVDVTKATINVDDLPKGVYVVHTLGIAQMMIKM